MYRVVSYNLHSGIGQDGRQDYSRMGEFLANTGADFVLLQEMNTRPAEREVTDDISAITHSGHFQLVEAPTVVTSTGWYGNAILSRFPVMHKHQIDVSKKNREPRAIQTIIVNTPKGQLALMNMHSGLKKHERVSQINALNSHIESFLKKYPLPLIVGGDFNEWWPLTRLFSTTDSLLKQHKFGPTFPCRAPLFALDRLWSNDGIQEISKRKILSPETRKFSDHLPIEMQFSII